ncbi:MAG: cysteine desulfurase [Methylobacteriaceae bacterium]|jgi:cysteine desulfurase|nr:cysteine desulfurase [Methylobacteriaceae bacterium]
MADDGRCYLDNNATTPVRPEVRAAMLDVWSRVGNASSVHSEGREARRRVESARDILAETCGAEAKNIVFTGSGTEANNYVLSPSFSVFGKRVVNRLLVNATEHASVLQGHRFAPGAVQLIPVNSNGLVDAEELARRLKTADGAALVSVQVANNETGVLQPVAEIARVVHEHGGFLHCDAVQALGKVPLDIHALGADVLTVSAHKTGGPQGVGAVIWASPDFSVEEKLIRGGGQERGSRAGTEDVAGIVGFGVALTLMRRHFAEECARIEALKRQCEAAVREAVPDCLILCESAPRVVNTFAFMVPGRKAETLTIAFDLAGVALSAGAACTSGKVGQSHVVAAMGLPQRFGASALRVSLGWSTAEEDVRRFASACQSVLSPSRR